MERVLKAKPLVPGRAEGPALVTSEPLSFWGGLNPKTGEIIDRRHERSGANVAGRVFFFPAGRGSSTASAILLDAIRNKVAPAALVTIRTDPILSLGAIVADEMYGQTIPVLTLEEKDFYSIREGDQIVIHEDGRLVVTERSAGVPPA